MFLYSLLGFALFAGTQPMFASLMEYVVDAIQRHDQSAALYAPAGILIISFVRGLGSFVGTFFLSKVTTKVSHILRCEVFDHYTRLPVEFFDNHNAGHLISYVTGYTEQMTAAAIRPIQVWAREGLSLLALLVYLFYLNWILSLAFVAIAPAIAALVSVTSKRFLRLAKKLQSHFSEMTHLCAEAVNGARLMKIFGGETYERVRFSNASTHLVQQSLKIALTHAYQAPVLQLLVSAALAALLYLSLRIMTESSPGEFVAYFTAAVMMPRSIRQVTNVAGGLQNGLAASERIFEILDTAPETDQGTTNITRADGHICFLNVSFAYPDQSKPALHDITFEILPGQTVAFVGPSGSGKTTIASLLMRFYENTGGTILLDGLPLSKYSLSSLRNQIALVTQHVTLFNDTIERNIAYGTLAGCSRDQVLEVAQTANALEFIQQTPNGLDTIIGPGGAKLSGGQKQRLAIARALLKDAPILILDEATSALDSETEKAIHDALAAVRRRRTTIIIAHRFSTILTADKIFVLKDGQLAEAGNHAQLLAKKGIYDSLYKKQSLAGAHADPYRAA